MIKTATDHTVSICDLSHRLQDLVRNWLALLHRIFYQATAWARTVSQFYFPWETAVKRIFQNSFWKFEQSASIDNSTKLGRMTNGACWLLIPNGLYETIFLKNDNHLLNSCHGFNHLGLKCHILDLFYICGTALPCTKNREYQVTINFHG